MSNTIRFERWLVKIYTFQDFPHVTRVHVSARHCVNLVETDSSWESFALHLEHFYHEPIKMRDLGACFCKCGGNLESDVYCCLLPKQVKFEKSVRVYLKMRLLTKNNFNFHADSSGTNKTITHTHKHLLRRGEKDETSYSTTTQKKYKTLSVIR